MMAHLGLKASAAPSSLPPAAPSTPSARTSLGSGSKRQRTNANDADANADADTNMPDATTTQDSNASNNSTADTVTTGNANVPTTTTAPTTAAASSGPRNFLKSMSRAVPTKIRYGTKARADTDPSDAGITLSSALKDMFERCLLHTGLPLSEFGGRNKTTVPFITHANQEKMNKCLLLVDMVWTEDQQAVLRAKPEKSNPDQAANVAKVAREIQDAVMTKMAELEKEAEAAGSKKVKAAGKRAQPKITGIGGRYQKYTVAIKELEEQSK